MLYLYGLVLPDVDVPDDLAGLGAKDVRVIGLGEVSAVVSDVDTDELVGTPAEIRAHVAVLDAVAADHAVLPMRFGTVVPDETAVERAFPAGRRAAFADELRRLAGLAQLTVRARYVQDTVLAELVAEDVKIARLRETLRHLPPHALRDARIRLGELVVRGFARKRARDIDVVLDELAPFAVEIHENETRQVDEVLELAALVRRAGRTRFEAALEGIAEREHGRITFRLVGPQAPYDFVEDW
ncbi:GvpL/GvpF family gas vesicle protein [Promicromonospora sp. NPDC019610]|uniref:GvpL/GvpF family gas vesicle protein n=1 Tax=Promicromonospora sp. NPDC019610 TaxID=3364405 RepID=UPI00378A95E1